MGPRTGARRAETLTPEMTSRSLARAADLAEGEARGFEVEGLRRKVIVVRLGGRFFGWLDACPHYSSGTPMAWKRDAYLDGERAHIACHAHGALFDIETGECVSGPCLGKRLTGAPLAVGEDGWIRVSLATIAEEEEFA